MTQEHPELISKYEMNEIAERAAGKALDQAFFLLGIDLDKKDSVDEFRANMDYTRLKRVGEETFRKTLKEKKWYLFFVGLGVFVTAIAQTVWSFIEVMFKGS